MKQIARGYGVQTLIIKRSVVLDGVKTSVSLEEQFWDGLREIADGRNLTRSALVSKIAHEQANSNLSSAIRVFVLMHFLERDRSRANSK